MSNPALWIAIAGVITAIAGVVKAYKAKDSADTANALLELHTSDHPGESVPNTPPNLTTVSDKNSPK